MTTSKRPPIKLPWFRVYSEMLEDPKMRDLTDAEWGIWTKILCLASKQPTRGKIILESSKKPALNQLAYLVHTRTNHLRYFVETAKNKNMIECELNGKKGYLTVINWDKRQFPSDSSTDRTRKWRARERHSDGTELDKDKDIDLKEPAPPASPAPLASLEKELGKYINEMKWGEAQAFAGAMLKKKEHPGAILDALMQITISQPEDPWAYGMTIVKTRSPTHRAKDHHRHSQEQYGKNNHH